MMSQIPPLTEEAILLVEVGSTAHGTGLPNGEDLDQMGVVIERPDEVFGVGHGRKTVMQRTQPEGVRSGPGDIDRTLHPLRRFLRLASTGNPSILMCLWAPVHVTTLAGDELRSLADAFVGRHVVPRYRGYMYSQSSRLMGIGGGKHGKRGGGQRPEVIELHGYDTKYAMHCSRLGFQCVELLTTGKLTFPIQGEPAEWLRSLRSGHIKISEWWERTLELDDQCRRLEDDTSIRSGPALTTIEQFSVRCHLQHWGMA